jgi:hypothetical protein
MPEFQAFRRVSTQCYHSALCHGSTPIYCDSFHTRFPDIAYGNFDDACDEPLLRRFGASSFRLPTIRCRHGLLEFSALSSYRRRELRMEIDGAWNILDTEASLVNSYARIM